MAVHLRQATRSPAAGLVLVLKTRFEMVPTPGAVEKVLGTLPHATQHVQISKRSWGNRSFVHTLISDQRRDSSVRLGDNAQFTINLILSECTVLQVGRHSHAKPPAC